MKLQEIAALTNSLIDDELPFEDILPLLNACNGDIVGQARHARRAGADYDTPGKMIALPDDCYEIELLTHDKKPLLALPTNASVKESKQGYRRWGNAVELTADLGPGQLEIFYIAFLPDFSGPEDEPIIPAPFHDLYALYAAARLTQGEKVNTYLPLKQDYWRDYLMRRDALDDATRKNRNRKTGFVRARPWI